MIITEVSMWDLKYSGGESITMDVRENLRKFLDSAGKNEGTALYRDPQEFMYMESRDNSSYVYAFGMSLFKSLTGTDYFSHINIPDDEYFMTIDPESDDPIIKPENVPDYLSDFSEILGQMTMYKRKSRISVQEALCILEKIYNPDTGNSKTEIEKLPSEPQSGFAEKPEPAPIAQEDIQEEPSYECKEPDCVTQNPAENIAVFPQIQDDYDYGIILNNKRYGRIEFRCLYDCVSNETDYIDIPVKNDGLFTIGISKRQKEYKHISNPASVYGDNIIPSAILTTNIKEYNKIRISFEVQGRIIKINIYGLDINNNIISGDTPLREEIRPV